MKERISIEPVIYTNYAKKSEAQEARLQIEQASHYISALFWFMKVASEGYDLLELQTDTELYSFGDLRANAALVAEIGMGIADQLTVYSLAIKDEKETNK